jgi:tetratricopeptide (TPR) repeat protein
MGDAHLYAGDRAKSKTWYAFAHENALRIGDRAAIGALMYNRAAFGLARARVERALEPLLEQGNAIAHAAIELESAHAFENAIRVVALPHLVPLTRARLMIVRQEYASALQLLESVLIDIEESESRPNKSHVLGDIAYCCAMVGDIGRTREIAQEMLLSNQADVDIDDRVVVLAQLLEVLISDRDRDLAQRLSRQFANASAEYRQNVADLRRVLGVIESRRLPKK